MNSTDAPVDAGRLLAFALDITASPAGGVGAAEYMRLVDRYREDASFRVHFDGVIEGAGCEVATANHSVGVVLRTRPDGPWAWPAKSADLPWNGFENTHLRAARALVIIALLAYLAPSGADLDDLLSDTEARLNPVGVRDLEQFVRDFCLQQESQSPNPTGDETSRPLWWHWLQLPAEAPTAKRMARTTTSYVVHGVLSFLHGKGWLIDVTPKLSSEDKRYRPRRRLLYHFHDLLLDSLFRALREHAEAAHAGASEHRTPKTSVTSGAAPTADTIDPQGEQ